MAVLPVIPVNVECGRDREDENPDIDQTIHRQVHIQRRGNVIYNKLRFAG